MEQVMSIATHLRAYLPIMVGARFSMSLKVNQFEFLFYQQLYMKLSIIKVQKGNINHWLAGVCFQE